MNLFLVYPWSSSTSDYIDIVLKGNGINFEVERHKNDIWKYTFDDDDTFKVNLLIKSYKISPLILYTNECKTD